MVLLAVLLAAGVGGTQYPAADILSAARDVCEVALASDDPAARIVEARWASYAPTAGDWVDTSLRDEKSVFGGASQVFVKQVTGRLLFAFVNVLRPKNAESRIRVCTVQDRTADIAADDIGSLSDAIVDWAGRAPFDNGIHLGEDLQKGFDTIQLTRIWKPGLNHDAADTVIRYFPVRFGGQNTGLTYASERVIGAGNP